PVLRHFIDNAPVLSEPTRHVRFFLCDLRVVDKEKGRTSNKARKSQSSFLLSTQNRYAGGL
ncbi:MAG TPA: hypothetical protein VM783_08070, partial [Candidatus Acidoferrum sp.]|nr:hypothetical protein [Candidatus Acidoferrum sp.]